MDIRKPKTNEVMKRDVGSKIDPRRMHIANSQSANRNAAHTSSKRRNENTLAKSFDQNNKFKLINKPKTQQDMFGHSAQEEMS